MTWDLLQWPGAALGLIGALLVAGTSSDARRLGFALWLGSNAFLIGWTLWSNAWGLFGMYVFYFITSALGLWNNRKSRAVVDNSQAPANP